MTDKETIFLGQIIKPAMANLIPVDITVHTFDAKICILYSREYCTHISTHSKTI